MENAFVAVLLTFTLQAYADKIDDLVLTLETVEQQFQHTMEFCKDAYRGHKTNSNRSSYYQEGRSRRIWKR